MMFTCFCSLFKLTYVCVIEEDMWVPLVERNSASALTSCQLRSRLSQVGNTSESCLFQSLNFMFGLNVSEGVTAGSDVYFNKTVWINSGQVRGLQTAGVFVFLSSAEFGVSVKDFPVSWSRASRVDVELREVDAVVVQILLLLQTVKFNQQVSNEHLPGPEFRRVSDPYRPDRSVHPKTGRWQTSFLHSHNSKTTSCFSTALTSVLLLQDRKVSCRDRDTHCEDRQVRQTGRTDGQTGVTCSLRVLSSSVFRSSKSSMFTSSGISSSWTTQLSIS